MSNKKLKRLVLSTAMTGYGIAMAMSTYAADDAMLKLLEVLRDDGTISQEAYELLRNTTLADEEKQEAKTKEEVREQTREVVEAEVAEATKDMPEINTKGKLEVKSRDGDFKFRVGGRIQADAAFYDNDVSDLSSGTEFRRVRLYTSGTVWKVWDFKLQYDFADTGDDVIDGIRDAYLRYTGLEPAEITVGHYKEPFSLEELTSSKYITFMERALPNVFAPGRNMGIGVQTHGSLWSTSVGFFGEGVDADRDNEGVAEGWGITGRVTFNPILEKTRVVHLGGAVSYRKTNQDNELRFRERPESHVTNTRLVDTGNFDVDDLLRFGTEAALVWGPASLQGEWIFADVNRKMSGNEDVDFDGWYIYGSWFLTGESRSYKHESGEFSGIKPDSVFGKGGIGAWEVGVRFSSVDLSDEDIDGGKEDNLTVGLNWYPNENIRFMANYVNVLDVDGGPNDGDVPNLFQLRAQLHF